MCPREEVDRESTRNLDRRKRSSSSTHRLSLNREREQTNIETDQRRTRSTWFSSASSPFSADVKEYTEQISMCCVTTNKIRMDLTFDVSSRSFAYVGHPISRTNGAMRRATDRVRTTSCQRGKERKKTGERDRERESTGLFSFLKISLLR
jgi:hypothetical protein